MIESISIIGITERMGPLGLHMYAASFLEAAASLPPPQVPFDPVRPYLTCHSIELSLRAFISIGGPTMLALSDGGHRLSSLLDKALAESLAAMVSLTPAQRQAIHLADEYYSGKVFEYPAVGEAMLGYSKMPPMDALLEAAQALVDGLRIPCREAR